MVGPKKVTGIAAHKSRKKRDTGSQWDATDRDTWVDSIGIPRGVPNEFKLVDQIASGFENLPIISALFPVTPNKNIDRINYIHYNVQKLSNRTRDAVTGLSEQLAATSLMAFQNRLALDMLLAEKGGVCAMFRDQCCTFIPNNTAPDGSVTKALAGMRALSNQMAEDSGVDSVVKNKKTDDGKKRRLGEGKFSDMYFVRYVFMASGDSLVSLAYSYRLGHATVMNSVHMVCAAIEKTMMERFLPRPTQETWEEVAQGFWEKWNFPNCLGAIDGKHVTIQAPALSGSQYQLQKNILNSAFGTCGLELQVQGHSSGGLRKDQ
ncbi:Endogenous retrovirus group V member 1 Env polyprotein [Merluccius polli]|uniref:Endogenous retrovirus group V member 1 Env polyprotein n=1 Tax=Merluccius polli TaxID=89951 RepID=A0AA47NA54_MERPO|nr:Endogenous retrovirus group V member 1 Env polyprotein [Merluccius polli]